MHLKSEDIFFLITINEIVIFIFNFYEHFNGNNFTDVK